MIKVGQKLWYVPRSKIMGSPCEVTVLKVGRKWAELDNQKRISIDSLAADGGQYSPPGHCYLSREKYDAKLQLSNEWSLLYTAMQRKYRAPDGITVDDIRKARELLRLPDSDSAGGK